MLYEPKYCCECGDQIERIEKNLLRSRKFCEVCETQYKFDIWLPRILSGIMVLFGIWGMGSYLQSSPDSLEIKTTQEVKNPRGFVRKEAKNKPNSQVLKDTDAQQLERKNDVAVEENEARRQTTTLKNGSLSEKKSLLSKDRESERQQKKASEAVYFCGAETKKGSPCSRRVKGGGRCWQHEGREAMLPKKELFIGSK